MYLRDGICLVTSLPHRGRLRSSSFAVLNVLATRRLTIAIVLRDHGTCCFLTAPMLHHSPPIVKCRLNTFLFAQSSSTWPRCSTSELSFDWASLPKLFCFLKLFSYTCTICINNIAITQFDHLTWLTGIPTSLLLLGPSWFLCDGQ